MKESLNAYGKLLMFVLMMCLHTQVRGNRQDTVELFVYSVDEGRSGLTLAWSLDGKEWDAIGPEHCFLFSDFGTWGSQKRMYSPFLFLDREGTWHCFWTLNNEVDQLAHAASDNLFEWKRQSYPVVLAQGNVLDLEVRAEDYHYQITWISDADGKKEVYTMWTEDFKQYTPAVKAATGDRLNLREEAEIDGIMHTGMVVRVPWKVVDGLIKHEQWTRYQEIERREVMADDPERFSGLEPLEATIRPRPEEAKSISDMLIGIFFEDISYAADGGLYAELIQNRDFEYDPGDKDFRDPDWNHGKSWSVSGDASFTIDSIHPVHPNNPHYAILRTGPQGGSLVNEGWDGIAVDEGKQYDVSLFARLRSGGQDQATVRLRAGNGDILDEVSFNIAGGEWAKYQGVITVKETTPAAALELSLPPGTAADLDMISLFPRNTFMGRRNGLRQDLAQVIAELRPKFVRFPGGCVAHGDGIANMYRWERTIGPLEERVPQRNIWDYHQTAGLGYFEYFQFCEDIGAEPLPVVPAGVPCQNSHTGGYGQQCGIPMGEMDEYTQSVLDLIEWANGGAETEWGRKRAEAGHPEPFHLKYIGVGNEDLITDVFEERFTMIYNAIREKHPEITVIGTVGPFSSGTDYEEGWDLARRLKLPMVDEHYYQPPGWFINHQDFYDRYDRNGTRVYLGEYASHVRGRRTNMETALSEALYLTSAERNADVVRMTSYAPLLAKEGHTNWNPDLIYFNNTEVKPTVDYYVQQLYGEHSGTRYIPSLIRLSETKESVGKRFGVSLVQDESNGDLIVKLVNLLPVPILTDISLDAFTVSEEGTVWILQGDPGAENVKPVHKPISIKGDLQYAVPEYSFSVIRLRTE